MTAMAGCSDEIWPSRVSAWRSVGESPQIRTSGVEPLTTMARSGPALTARVTAVVEASLSSIAAISSPCALSGEMTANFKMCFLSSTVSASLGRESKAFGGHHHRGGRDVDREVDTQVRQQRDHRLVGDRVHAGV